MAESIGLWRTKCPHCSQELDVPLFVGVGAGQAVSAEVENPSGLDVWLATLPEDERHLAIALERDGVSEAYASAFKEHTGQPPDRPVKSMWGFFARAVEAKLPPPTLNHYRQTYERQPIQVLSYNGVCAILSGGELKEFVPLKFLRSERRVRSGGGVLLRTANTAESAERWTRTKFGYVPVGSAFTALLSRRSIGAFDNVRG